MKVLVVGSGGREHALCWAIAKSPLCSELICAPGNAGIGQVARRVAVRAEDVEGLVALARDEAVDLVVVGPEAPLVAGLVDRLEAAGIRAFGPSAAAARLEGSKAFMKEILVRAGVPTARYRRFTDLAAALAHVADHTLPVVIKADGLAAGKGVIIAQTRDEAEAALRAMLVEGAFGAAGATVVVEEFLEGEEASFFALVDGTTALPLIAAQDHKRVGDGDTGPNTGGMGAYSPAPVVDEAIAARIMAEVIEPTVKAMAAAGAPYRGVLFAGLMIGPDGPRTLEFNVRFGDPECQVLMARLDGDLLALLLAAAEGRLAEVTPRWKAESALCVVMATRGYPGGYEKGSAIGGLEAAGRVPGVLVFHAGTREGEDGKVLADGGRVLGVTAIGQDVAAARAAAYTAVDLIDWPEGFCRRDIAHRALRG